MSHFVANVRIVFQAFITVQNSSMRHDGDKTCGSWPTLAPKRNIGCAILILPNAGPRPGPSKERPQPMPERRFPPLWSVEQTKGGLASTQNR